MRRPKFGQQKVVSVTPERIVTEPIKPPAPAPKSPDIKPIEGHSAKDVLSNNPANRHVFEGNRDGGYHLDCHEHPKVNADQLRDSAESEKGERAWTRLRVGIEYRDFDGTIKTKVKDSTMFPAKMSEKEVLERSMPSC